MRRSLLASLAFIAALAPGAAFAHPADSAHVHGVAAGLLHPLTGPDHLLAMIAVGIWGASLGRASAWVIPASFVTGMSAGIFLGSGVASASTVETFIAASVLTLGLFLALSVKISRARAMTIVGIAGFAHGAAHAMEGPVQADFLAFAAGALAMTGALHAIGVGVGMISERLPRFAAPAIGVSIALTGLSMAIGAS